MRPIYLVTLDKTRPAVLLTRQDVAQLRRRVTVAAVTSTVRGLSVEVPVGVGNGLDHPSVINCDEIYTVPSSALGRVVGYLHDDQEGPLAAAIANAFDLEV